MADFDPKEYLRQETLEERRGGLKGAVEAGVQGVAKGIASAPGMALINKASGISDNAQREVEEANPVASKLGEAVGLGGSMLTGVGEGRALLKAGELAAPLIKNRLGSAIVKGAVENALYQAGDETAKAILHDPNQSVGSAVANTGLAALLGGGLGLASKAVNPLWQATVGKKLNGILSKVAADEGGVEGVAAVAPEVGPRIDPFTKQPLEAAAPSFEPNQGPRSDPFTKQPVRTAGLPESSFGANNDIREIAQNYADRRDLGSQKHTNYADVSPERGARIAQAYEQMPHAPTDPEVRSAYNALIRETLDQYQEIKKMGLKIEFIKPEMRNPYPQGSKQVLKDIKNGHLWVFPTEEGFGSSTADLAGNPLLQKTNEYIGNKQLVANDVFRIVHDIFGHAKEGFAFGPRGEENAWRAHVKMYSPEAAKAMTTETRGQNSWVNFGPNGEANRANPGKTVYADQKTGILPEWARTEGLEASPKDKVSTPQSTPEAPKPVDWASSTLPMAAWSGLIHALGGGHLASIPILAKTLKVGEGIAERGLLKYMATAKDINPAGFAKMAGFLNAAAKGDALASDAAKAVFTGGRVLPSNAVDKSSTGDLDKLLKSLEERPQALLEQSGGLDHYLPDHASALGQLGASAVTYLNSLRPRSEKASPLDSEPVISEAQKGPFERQLALAEQPLLALQHIKEGTLLPQDVQTLQNLYPKLHADLAQKLFAAMTEHLAAKKGIPQHIKQSMSLFAGHALDSTLQPQSIVAAQAVHQAQAQGQQQQQGPAPKNSKANLSKQAELAATPGQKRELHEAKA